MRGFIDSAATRPASVASHTLAQIEAQQMVSEFFHAIDSGDPKEVGTFYDEAGVFEVGSMVCEGRDAVVDFYCQRQARIRKNQAGGVRTSRHLVANPRYYPCGEGAARYEFMLVYFSADGAAPIIGSTLPSVVADCSLSLRWIDGQGWKISRFVSTQVFLGNDPFLNAVIARPA